MTMVSPADATAGIIASLGLGSRLEGGTSDPWPISVAVEPDVPVQVVTVYDNGGPGLDTDDQDMAEPSVQVRVRCQNYRDGYAKAADIRSRLVAFPGATVGVLQIIAYSAESDVLPIGQDDSSDAFLFTINLRVLTQISE